MGNMGEIIDSSSFDVAFGSLSEEVPLVFVNNVNNQENITIVGDENKSQDYLPSLFQSVIV